MLLSVTGFDSAKTVQIRIYNVTTTTETVAWTATGVAERANGEGKSTYYYDYAITANNEYIIDWKDNSSPVRTAAETINIPYVNVTQISGDAAAADNLEAQYDGTGYINPSAPAYQGQMSSIAGGLSLRENIDSSTVISGSAAGAISLMNTDDDNRYIVTADAGTGALEFVLLISPADNTRMPVDAHLHCFYDEAVGATNSALVQAYNFDSAAWETLETLTNAAIDISFDLPMSVSNSAPGSGTISTVNYVQGDVLMRFIQSVNEIGSTINIDHLTIGFAGSPLTAAEVWAEATRTLTAGTNIVLAKGVGVTGFNDLSAAQVNTECDTALTDYDPPTRTEATADKDAIIVQVDANETKIDTLLTRATELRLAELDPANIPTDIANVKAETALILDDTGTAGVVVASGSKAGYSLAADQSGVTVGTVNALGAQAKLDVNAEVDTALNTAIPGSPTADSINERVKAVDDLTQAGGSGDLAAILTALTVETLTVVTDISNSSLQFKTNLSSSVNDFYKGMWIVPTTGVLIGAAPRKVSTYNGSTKILTLTSGYTSTPADGVIFAIISN